MADGIHYLAAALVQQREVVMRIGVAWVQPDGFLVMT